MAGPQAPRSSPQGGMMFATTLTVRAAMTSSSTRPVPGCARLVRRLRRAHVQEVVISPNQVHSLRGRYGSAGNKDDRFDAFVLADTLRTDRARLRPLIPDSPATVQLAELPRKSPTGG